MSQHCDLDGITLTCAKACVTSIQAHGPLTKGQRERLEKIYNLLLDLSSEVAGIGGG